MKYLIIIFLIIIFEIISIKSSTLDNWNISYSSINLLENKIDGNYEYPLLLFNQTQGNVNVYLYKTITIKDGQIFQSNSIVFSHNRGMNTEQYVFLTNWEDISSLYFIGEKIFVCPKGTNYLHYYYNNKLFPIKTDLFPDEYKYEDWELKCYYPNNNKTIFFTFLNNRKIKLIYYYKIRSNTTSNLTIDENDKILDFKWETISQNESRMFGLFLFGTKIYLRLIYFEIKDINTIEKKKSYELDSMDIFNSTYLYAFFTNSNYSFYWMAYNETTNLLSGYIKYIFNYENGTIGIGDKVSKINNIIPLNIFSQSPPTLKTIRNTKYAYYEILVSKFKKIFQRGIIDLSLNKVVFNTNEDINDFIPFSPYSMLLITNKSAYEVCVIKENGKCIENCGYDKNHNIILSPEKGNYCSAEKICEKNKKILLPEKICIDECNEHYYILKNDCCSICNDIEQNEIYTLIKNKTCVNSKPNNTYYINEELKMPYSTMSR